MSNSNGSVRKQKKVFRSRLNIIQSKGLPIKALTLNILKVDTTLLHDSWVKIYNHECNYRGRAEAIRFMKQLYQQAVQYCLYEDISELPFRKTLVNTNMVKQLKLFKPYLRGNIPKTRAALTVLRQFEMLFDEPSYNISTVTSLPDRYNNYSKAKFKLWLKLKRRLPIIDVGKVKDHLTTKKGPSGYAAMTSWDSDAYLLPPYLLTAIKRLAILWGDNAFSSRIDTIRDILLREGFKPTKRETCSRIQVFTAGGGKTRIIAIYDYWSQRILKPLHRAMFKNLRTIKEDATFSHDSAADWLLALPKGKDIYCFDLTAATDRIPMWIHQSVLHSHLPKNSDRNEIVKLWTTIINERDFQLSWDPKRTVRYNTGQPMGAYSSWAFLAYSHHCIARFCGAHKNGYRIIGDDIVILGDAGRTYKKFMLSHGIKISEGKSIVSYKESKHQTGEVAKRIILDGVEITPPTPKLIYQCFKDWKLIPMLLTDIVRRGWKIRTADLMSYLNIYSDNWKYKVITVLTFPTRNPYNARIREVLYDESPWNKYDKTELLNFFIRYRMYLLNKTLASTVDFNPYPLLAGFTLDEQPRTELYDLSPVPFIRADMTMKILMTVSKLDDYVFKLDSLNAQDIEQVLSIKDEEMFVPDPRLQFLDMKYRRQIFQASVLIDLRTHIEKGTITKYMNSRIPKNLDPRLVRGCAP